MEDGFEFSLQTSVLMYPSYTWYYNIIPVFILIFAIQLGIYSSLVQIKLYKLHSHQATKLGKMSEF